MGVSRGGRQLGPWPRSTWITRTSMLASNRCVAKLWRSVCKVAGFLTPAMCLAEVKTRFSWRGEIGLIFGLPPLSECVHSPAGQRGTANPPTGPRATRRATAPAIRATA